MAEERFFCVSCVAPFQFSFLSFLCWSPIRTCSLIIVCSFVRGLVPDPWVTFVGHFRGSLFVDVVGHFWSLIVVLVVAAVVVVDVVAEDRATRQGKLKTETQKGRGPAAKDKTQKTQSHWLD